MVSPQLNYRSYSPALNLHSQPEPSSSIPPVAGVGGGGRAGRAGGSETGATGLAVAGRFSGGAAGPMISG